MNDEQKETMYQHCETLRARIISLTKEFVITGNYHFYTSANRLKRELRSITHGQ